MESSHCIRTIQERIGYKDSKTTMIYTQVLNREPLGAPSPADFCNTANPYRRVRLSNPE
jgi:hypothetical protein